MVFNPSIIPSDRSFSITGITSENIYDWYWATISLCLCWSETVFEYFRFIIWFDIEISFCCCNWYCIRIQVCKAKTGANMVPVVHLHLQNGIWISYRIININNSNHGRSSGYSNCWKFINIYMFRDYHKTIIHSRSTDQLVDQQSTNYSRWCKYNNC